MAAIDSFGAGLWACVPQHEQNFPLFTFFKQFTQIMFDLSIQFNIEDFTSKIASIVAAINAKNDNTGIREGTLEAARISDGFQRRKFSAASHGSGDWSDIKPATKRERIFKTLGSLKGIPTSVIDASFSLPVMYITGQKYQSLVDGPDHFLEISRDSIKSGSQAPHVYVHQLGLGRLPSRPIVQLPDSETLGLMANAVRAGLVSAIADSLTQVSRTTNSPIAA